MKRFILVVLVVVVAGFAAPSFAQMEMKDGRKATLEVFEPTVVGKTTLQAGEYNFQCRHIDGVDYLVVTTTVGKEVTRVPCKPANIEGKLKQSDYRTVQRADGTKILTAVRIKGETVAHIVIND